MHAWNVWNSYSLFLQFHDPISSQDDVENSGSKKTQSEPFGGKWDITQRILLCGADGADKG